MKAEFIPVYELLKKWFAIFFIVIGMTVLIGWVANLPFILSILDGGPTMKFNTAALFVLTGIVFLKNKNLTSWPNTVLLVIIFLTSLITGIQYVFDFNLGFDEMVFADPYSLKYAGRMSPATVTCFVLFSISFYAVHQRNKSVVFFGQVMNMLLIVIALVSTLGYILIIPFENRVFFVSTMAIHTSVLFLFIGYLISGITPNEGLNHLLSSRFSGSSQFRKLLFFVVFPIISAMVLLSILNQATLQSQLGIVSITIINILFFLCYISYWSWRLNNADSERLRREDFVNKHINELASHNDDLVKSIITLTHDLKQPLVGLMFNINRMDYLSNHSTILEKNNDKDLVIGQLDRLMDTIVTWSSYARGSSISLEDVDLEELIQSVKTDLSKVIAESGTEIMSEGLPSVKAYKTPIRLLFQNLLGNAAKYRDLNRPSKVNFSYSEDEEYWTIAIADNGRGVPESDLESIFEFDYKVNEDDKGTGMGLGHCKNIVSIHKGKIWAKPNESGGTTFYFTVLKKLQLIMDRPE